MPFTFAPAIAIRPLRAEDAPDLHKMCWPELSYLDVQIRVNDVLARQRRSLTWGFVIECNDHLIGYGQIGRWGTRVEISDLIVNSDWRRMGIGTALIEHLLQFGRMQHFTEVEIGVALSNKGALRLYRRLGFADDRRVRLDLGKGTEPVVFLKMPLAALDG